MNVMAWMIVGAIIGWLASIVMQAEDRQGIVLDIVVGSVGAALGGWFLSPLFGVPAFDQSHFSLPALLVAFLGAVVLVTLFGMSRSHPPKPPGEQSFPR